MSGTTCCPRCGVAFQGGVTVSTACPACGTPTVVTNAALTPPGATRVDPAAPPRLPAPPSLPGYEILGALGRGGMGVVYRARQVALDRLVAIKAVLTSTTEDAPEQLARFEREARLVARLRHPNIVLAHDLLHQDGRLFLVMELIDGDDLHRHVEAAGPLSEPAAWALVRQVAAGLAHAAEAGVVHRDVKPANVLLARDAGGLVPKITDFGLALLAPGAAVGTAGLTNPGTLLGTPSYMAPEQFAGSHVDWRADLYALGATAAFLLTGQEPYRELPVWEVMRRKVEDDFPLPAGLSNESRHLLGRMLARDPERRFASYAELLDALEYRTAASTVVGPRRPVPAGPSRRWVGVAAAGLILAGLGAWWLTWPAADPPPPRLRAGPGVPLFNGQNLAGWVVAGGGWQPATDDEGGTVLAGTGLIRRPLPALTCYRVLMGVNRRTARTVEVHFGLREPQPQAERCVLRVTADAVTLGRQQGGPEAFRETARRPVAPAGDGGTSPYREVRLDRTQFGWYASYDGQLVGRLAAHDGEAAEVQLRCDGGPAHFESIEVLELVPG